MKYDLKNQYKCELATTYFEKLKEKKAMIELKEMRMPHSVDSHRLYFLWLNCIAHETGRDKDELHYLYRATFLQKSEEEICKYLKNDVWQRAKTLINQFTWFPGMSVIMDIIAESTAIKAQDSKQFTVYLDKIRKHARVNFDIILLTKEDKHFEDFYREYGFR